MVINRKILSTLSIAGILIGTGCSTQQMVKMAEQQELKVNPSPLELHGDSVAFDVQATLPVNMLKKNRLYTIKTYYSYGDPTQELAQIEFKDTEFPNQKVEQPQQKRHFSFFYEESMKSGELKIKGLVSNLEKTKYKETPELSIAKGVITTSRLVKPSYKVLYADHGYNNQEELVPTQVEFFFEKGSSKLRSSEVKGDAGQKLNAFIAAKNKTKTVTIFGSHSPEGLESVNSKLAEQRATVIKNFYAKQMKMYDYKQMADSIKFETKAIFQDWTAFKKELAANESISPEDKQAVLAIVNSSEGSFHDKERELSKLPVYKTLTSEIYPKLRISKTEILSVKPKKTDAEINVLSKSIVQGSASADTLNMEELLYSATLTPLIDEKAAIYEAATKKGSSWVAHNNLGATYVEKAMKASEADKKGLLDKAEAQFKLAANLKETAVTLNNRGILELFANKKDAAAATYASAMSKSPSADAKKSIQAGMGAIEIMRGNYVTAIDNLGSAGSDVENAIFNLGLAQLLNRDYVNAEKSFETAIYINKKNALAYYCSAITAARQDNVEKMGIQLKEAIALDAKLADKALMDLEFVDYWTNETFLNALK